MYTNMFWYKFNSWQLRREIQNLILGSVTYAAGSSKCSKFLFLIREQTFHMEYHQVWVFVDEVIIKRWLRLYRQCRLYQHLFLWWKKFVLCVTHSLINPIFQLWDKPKYFQGNAMVKDNWSVDFNENNFHSLIIQVKTVLDQC